MFEVKDVHGHSLDAYREFMDQELLDELEALGRDLKGLRVAHINAVQRGGGVAEILNGLIPLYQGLEIDATRLVLEGEKPYFEVTKRLHNALQGDPRSLSPADWEIYLDTNRRNAADLACGYDVVIVHDPQPAAMRQLAEEAAQCWIWRCHIDTSFPNQTDWDALVPYVKGYDAAVFSLDDFVGPHLEVRHVCISPPAIDPLSPKNTPKPIGEARDVVAAHGIDVTRPFISQISRFDPWKDPLGVIECFRMLRAEHPSLQLVLLADFPEDDPEGSVIYGQVMQAVDGLADVHIVVRLTDQVGVFQSLSAVVLQKSIREGFALTVTEALWKGTPVVGGNVGGIRLQIVDGVTGGFLVDSVDECAEKVDYLLTHEEERKALGLAGREHVRKNFLLPRLLRDEMRLMSDLVNHH